MRRPDALIQVSDARQVAISQTICSRARDCRFRPTPERRRSGLKAVIEGPFELTERCAQNAWRNNGVRNSISRARRFDPNSSTGMYEVPTRRSGPENGGARCAQDGYMIGEHVLRPQLRRWSPRAARRSVLHDRASHDPVWIEFRIEGSVLCLARFLFRETPPRFRSGHRFRLTTNVGQCDGATFSDG